MQGYYRLLRTFVVSIVLIGANINLAMAPALSDQGVHAKYTVLIDPQTASIIVNMTIENIDEDYLEFAIPGLPYYINHNVDITTKIISSNNNLNKINRELMKIYPVNGRVEVVYQIQGLSLQKIVDVPSNPYLAVVKKEGISDSFFHLSGMIIFAVPTIEKYTTKGDILIKFVIPDDWEVFCPYERVGHNTFKTVGFGSLVDAISGGKVLFKVSKKISGIELNYILFEKPTLKTNYGSFGRFVVHRDLNLTKEGEESLEETAFYALQYGKMFRYSPPHEINIAAHVENLRGWRGWWVFREKHQQDQTAHHIFHQWIPSVVCVNPGYFEEGLAVYYESVLPYVYTKDPMWRGKMYLNYLLYERGIRDRLQRGDDVFHNDLLAYNFYPLVIFYFDKKIREATDKSIDDVVTYILEKYRFKCIREQDFIEAIYESTGVDMQEFYQKHVVGDYYLPIAGSMMEYKDDFSLYLDFQRRNNGAPDILYYALLELEAQKGNPDFTIHIGVPYMRYDYVFTSSQYREFINDLLESYPVTKEEFIAILNKYTGNHSSDFFEFYEKYGPRPPTIKSLNYWIEGKYSQLIQKQVYLDTKLKILSERVSDAHLEALNEIKEEYMLGTTFLNNEQFEETQNVFEDAIRKLEGLERKDTDNDKVPDIVEEQYNLNPLSIDSDDGIPDKYEVSKEIILDGSLLEWDRVDVTKLETGYTEQKLLENVGIYTDGEYLYGYIVTSRPAYYINRANIQVEIDLDGNPETWEDSICFPISTIWSFWGSEMAYKSTCHNVANINKYSYILDNTIEFKIPLQTIRIAQQETVGTMRDNILLVIKVNQDKNLDNNIEEGTLNWADIRLNLSKMETPIYSHPLVTFGKGRIDEEYASSLKTVIKGSQLIPDIDFEINSKEQIVVILVGGPVANTVTREYMHLFPVEVTNSFPGKNRGVIEAIPFGDTFLVLLAGSDRWGTKATVEVFKKLSYIPSKPIFVSWNEGQPKIIEANPGS